MATSLTAQVAESRCRQRIADVAAAIWTPTQMMEALDDALNSIWTTVRRHGRDRLLERLDVSPASFTSDGQNSNTYSLPASVGPIRMVEGITNGRPVEILQAELDFKDWSQSSWTGPAMVWFRSASGNVAILGQVSRFTSVRFWYHRRWPPMHYGLTNGLGTTSTLIFDDDPTGRVVQRDVYDGVEIEFTDGAHKDKVVRVTDFNAATVTATFAPVLGGVVADATPYSLVVPVDPEHGEYVIEEMAGRFLERSGNANYSMARDPRLVRLREDFLQDLMHRDQAAPPTVYSHR